MIYSPKPPEAVPPLQRQSLLVLGRQRGRRAPADQAPRPRRANQVAAHRLHQGRVQLAQVAPNQRNQPCRT